MPIIPTSPDWGTWTVPLGAEIPKPPMLQEEAAALVEAGHDRRAIDQVRSRFAYLRDTFFPKWRERIDAEIARRMETHASRLKSKNSPATP